MSESFGPNVSRTLSALQRQFEAVVWQKGKPPLDAELNLMSQIGTERVGQALRAVGHSGFLLDPTRSVDDFVTDPSWSNFFKLGRQEDGELAPMQFALVNGWVIPVTGTNVEDGDTSCRINLNPPPASDDRIDFVFLEAWAAVVAPNSSTDNKPSASTLWAYGNVEFGGTNLTDDLLDPTLMYETTERIQVQYRLRVVGSGAGLGASVALDVYPDGLGDPNVLGQGAAASPVAGFTFTNMREEMGDSSLWRAGDGDSSNDLGTVDGYVYAIPVCAVFRRNTSPYTSLDTNQNGGLDRNPSASTLPDPRDGAKELTTATLTSALTFSAVGALAITGLSGSGFDDAEIDLPSTYLQIDDEIIGPLTAVSSTTVTIGAGARGRFGTMAVPHVAGSTVAFYNPRPDGLFSDQVTDADIMDLRHGTTLGEWDHQRILIHNLTKVVNGTLRTSYKQSAVGDTEGTRVVEVSYLLASGSAPTSTLKVDGPDGVRTVFSDAASVQTGVTVLCDTPSGAGTVTALDAGVDWDVAADFKPSGFFPSAGYTNGTSLFLNIGGSDGDSGARGSFDGDQLVRFVTPQEFWKTNLPDSTTGLQTPVTLRFLSEAGLQPAMYGEDTADHPGPLYPTADSNFETPFIVLGGVLNSSCYLGGCTVHNNSPSSGAYEIDLPGFDFDTAGLWYPTGAVGSTDPSDITYPVLRGQRTLYDMLTNGGADNTGMSSQVYLVLYGDTSHPANNGAFQIIGAGTAGYTSASASTSSRVRVRFLSNGVSSFTATSNTYTAEIRSQFTNAEDGTGGSATPPSSLAIVITDITGASNGSPWAGILSSTVTSKAVISTSLQYHPGRGATARVMDTIWRVAGVGLGSEYLRQSPVTKDTTFTYNPSSAEIYFDPSHVQTWNRLPSRGLNAPDAPAYGGGIANSSEQTRESEVFVDRGSKTLVFRPFLDRSMTLQARITTASAGNTLLGPSTYPGPTPATGTLKDGAAIWTSNHKVGFEVPPEFMPRFGRQDIPYNDGTGSFFPGINHLFTDSNDTTEAQHYIIGGEDTATTTVQRMYVQTGATTGYDYGEHGTITGPGSPAYQGRLYSSSTVISSDLGRGLKGIQLPPYLGIARLYGVYDRRDFVNNGGSAYNDDRITLSGSGAKNLLRTDASKQTLFILEGGAEDATGSASDHTYIVPSDAINIELSAEYNSGESFEDLDYVLEFCSFGFARGFINENNYVLCRKHKGATTVTDSDSPEAAGARMTIPAPASTGDAVYVGATRTVYQGDPYMSRAGNTRSTTDYDNRYGQIPMASQYELNTSCQQFDDSGNLIPETPNRRALQVLASVDFYTTMGSGKIGGMVFPGTVTDVGHTEATVDASTRLPSSSSQPAWRVVPRTYTAGQQEVNSSRATLGVEIVANGSVSGQTVTITVPGVGAFAFLGGTDFSVGANATATAALLAAAIRAEPLLSTYVSATNTGTTVVTVEAVDAGAVGNSISISISSLSAFALRGPRTGSALANQTKRSLVGGVDVNVNAGYGTSQVDLTGMIERFPLGILLQDSDFLCENPLNDNASAFATLPPGIQPVQEQFPLAANGSEYTRFIGGPGQWIALADGGVLAYAAYNADTAPTGSKKFRIFRGGGAAFVLSGPVPGGPVDWVSGSFPASFQPVLKGGILVCKALLVRNMPESAFSSPTTTTEGDELQMVILTYGILGDGKSLENGIRLSGEISPTGYGDGYAAADRYRLDGRPMSTGRARALATFDAEPAVYPGKE